MRYKQTNKKTYQYDPELPVILFVNCGFISAMYFHGPSRTWFGGVFRTISLNMSLHLALVAGLLQNALTVSIIGSSVMRRL